MKEIKVLGSGCASCKNLANSVEQMASELGIEFELTKVTDFIKIAEYGVMSTPGLVIDGEVKSVGRLPKPEEIKSWLMA
jgi:small redox-active disulfide protein 2